ncbi:MAG TPA: hypothetical protein VEF33_10980 [Syntrophales bacterium]|nr:hypothetical protein [Syntrophales bacterium]
MIKASRFLCIFFCFSMFLSGGLHGCGKKGDPRPSGVLPPKAVSDLRAKIAEAGVILHWSVPEAKGGIRNFKIQRSGLPIEGTVCPDCPHEYNIIADISVNDPALIKEEGKFVSYLDSRINAGYFYTYRIIACDISGICSEASNIQEVKISPDMPYGKEKQQSK